MFYSNPDCKTQCDGLPYGTEYLSLRAQKLVISLKVKIALVVARENEFLWNPPDEFHALESFDHS